MMRDRTTEVLCPGTIDEILHFFPDLLQGFCCLGARGQRWTDKNLRVDAAEEQLWTALAWMWKWQEDPRIRCQIENETNLANRSRWPWPQWWFTLQATIRFQGASESAKRLMQLRADMFEF